MRRREEGQAKEPAEDQCLGLDRLIENEEHGRDQEQDDSHDEEN